MKLKKWTGIAIAGVALSLVADLLLRMTRMDPALNRIVATVASLALRLALLVFLIALYRRQ